MRSGSLRAVLTAGLSLIIGLGASATAAAAAATTATVTIPTGGGDAPTLTLTTPVTAQTPTAITTAARRSGAAWAGVSVRSRTDAQAMPAGFVGLSLEYGTIERYAAVGSLFDQIVQNLTPGQRPIIRVGGSSADHATVPIPGFHNPGVWQTLGTAFLAAVRGLAVGLDAHLIPDLDMEVNDPRVPAAEVRTMLATIGSRYIPAFELGNEPGLYNQFAWYKVNGKPVFSRPPTWDPAAYVTQINATVGHLDGVGLWGPALSAGANWWSSLPQLAAAIPHLTTITVHAYPTSCLTTKPSQLPSVANLLAPSASVGLAARVKPEIAFAARTHRLIRVDETNTTNCAGTRAIPSFASALWAIETGFAMDKAGVSGLNIELYPGAADRPFSFSDHNRAVSVADEYYGWMLFARAAPPGSRQLSTATTGNPDIEAFASRTATSATSVVLINDSPRRSATVTLTVAGTRRAVVEVLDGSGLFSAGHVSLAGLRISPATGELAGSPRVRALGGSGRYSVVMRPGSADLIQLTR